MATPPLAFIDFLSRCMRPCGEQNPSVGTHCPICTEEYDRGVHHAARIVVQPPAQCNHEFCRNCLFKIFSSRTTHDNANICPLCHTTWFQAEYEGVSARSQRLANEVDNAPLTQSSVSQPFATSNEASPRDSATVPFLQREPRPYARTGRRPPPVARPHTSTRPTHNLNDLRTSLHLYQEAHAAIAADRAEAASTMPQAASSKPYHGLDIAALLSGILLFGQQAAPITATSQISQESHGRPTNSRPVSGVYNHSSDGRGTTRGNEQSRAVSPLPPMRAELQRRTAALDAREAQLAQRELRIERERQELQRRRQEFNALTEHARKFLRNRDADM